MKKIILLIVLIITMSIGGVSFAATTYNSEENSAANDAAENYSTVLITNVENDEIVYVNQAADKFAATTNFFLKSSADNGKYKITMGGSELAVVSSYFAIGVGEESGDIEIPCLNDAEVMEDGTYRMGFALNAESPVNLEDCGSLLLQIGEKVLQFETPTIFSGNGTAVIAIQLENIPADVYAENKNNITMFIRPDLNK